MDGQTTTGKKQATKAERRERALARILANTKGTDRCPRTYRKRINKLGNVIADAFRERGEVTIQDGINAGFSENEFRRLYDRAMEHAKKVEPRIGGGVSP